MNRRLPLALVVLATLAAGCGGSTPPAPSPSPSVVVPTPTVTASAQGTATAATPSAAAPATPQYTLTGPRPFDCSGPPQDLMKWTLDLSDAGPRGVHFVAHTHQESLPGCGATAKNPRKWIALDGQDSYAPHGSGRTTFTFNPRQYTCGRVQIDISLFDGDGTETLIVAAVLDYGTRCEPPLTCAPSSLSATVNGTATVTAAGGSSPYAWSAPGGSTTSGSGSTFNTSYASPGSKTITVSSGTETASCQVQVAAPALTCSPSTQSVAVNAPATLTAAGGSGSYNWIAFVASVGSGTGSSFTTSWGLAGTKAIILGDGLTTTSCQVVVN